MRFLLVFLIFIFQFFIYVTAKDQGRMFQIDYNPADSTIVEISIFDSVENVFIHKKLNFSMDKLENPESEIIDLKKSQIFLDDTTDSDGTVIILHIPEGIYLVRLFEEFQFKVEIKKNHRNKITIFLSKPHLKFSYMKNRGKIMNEIANVKNRESGIIDSQYCNKVKAYDAGKYYVSLNTIPESKFTIEMTYNSVYELQIPEPIELILDNFKDISNIHFYTLHGDNFAIMPDFDFRSRDKLIKYLVPGLYKVTWVKNGRERNKVLHLFDKTNKFNFM